MTPVFSSQALAIDFATQTFKLNPPAGGDHLADRRGQCPAVAFGDLQPFDRLRAAGARPQIGRRLDKIRSNSLNLI